MLKRSPEFDAVAMPRCTNCGKSFDEHLEESEPAWLCVDSYQSIYGRCTGDPALFFEDHEAPGFGVQTFAPTYYEAPQ